MNFLELLSPVVRRKNLLLILVICISALFFGVFQMIPESQKTTVYFSIKVMPSANGGSVSLDPPESASKIAEAIEGWAKNPAFRNEILKRADIEIGNFKRKITARKQNRINVFWTIKLSGEEMQHSQVIAKKLIDVLYERVDNLSQNSAFPFEISAPEVAQEMSSLPTSWLAAAAIFMGLFLGFIFVFLWESLRGRVSFISQIKNIFPGAPVLRISDEIGEHDKKVLENYILTFDNPRLFPGFENAEKHFSFSNIDDIDFELETPILITKLGESTLRELENFKAVFGESIGIVVFER